MTGRRWRTGMVAVTVASVLMTSVVTRPATAAEQDAAGPAAVADPEPGPPYPDVLPESVAADPDAFADVLPQGDPETNADMGPAAAVPSYAGLRIVKVTADDPSTPEIVLPTGYDLVPGAKYNVASRAEYYSFVRGPKSTGIPVTVRWPATPIKAVIATETRLPLARAVDDPYQVTFTLPVLSTSASANQATLQVWSILNPSTSSGVHWRIEHNDPDRVAGPWTTGSWPAGPVAAAVNYLFATNEILQDSGLAAEARRKGHFFALMGFETNNTLHPDNPPHWHLAYYPGLTFNAAKAHVPHFWVDARGRTFYNGMDIQGQGRSRFHVGDPATIHDPTGTVVVTLTIRADGGLDIDPPGGPRYSITAPDGDFTSNVEIVRDGVPWLAVRTTDHVDNGLLAAEIRGLQSPHEHRTTHYRYDELTGVLTAVLPQP